MLQKIAGFGSVATLVPTSWVKPVINGIVLPAHAQTSIISTVENVTILVSETVGSRLSTSDSRIQFSQGVNSAGTEFSQIIMDVLTDIGPPDGSAFSISRNPAANIELAGVLGIKANGNFGVLWTFNLTAGDKIPLGEFKIEVKIEYPDGNLNFVSFSVFLTKV